MKLESLALHSGYTSEATTKADAVPIYETTSFTFDNTQHGADLFDLKVPGNIYTRIMNPTTAVLEQRLADAPASPATKPSVEGVPFASTPSSPVESSPAESSPAESSPDLAAEPPTVRAKRAPPPRFPNTRAATG